MTLRARSMRAEDVSACAGIIRAHPVIGPRYGRALKDLPLALLRLFDYEAKKTLVIEEVDGRRATTCFVGVSLFVSDDFVCELKRAPLFWVGPELVRRMMRGVAPIISPRQLREGNARGGLTTLTWEGCIRTGFEKHTQLHRKVLSMFIADHQGYLWKEAIAAQLESVERLQWTLQSGGLVWDPIQSRYVGGVKKRAQEFIREPHLVGVTRDLEQGRPGTWVGALFDYHPPRLAFSPGEQRLLQCSLETAAGTDEELAEALGLSLPSVKKRWSSIYRRVVDRQFGIVRESAGAETRTAERGKEKRRRLLAYLREHMEELRPVSQRLLRQQGSFADGFSGAGPQVRR